MVSIVSKKICMLGDFSVGKTSLIRRFVDCEFSDQYLSTVGVKISKKVVECQSADRQKQTNVQMLIWDLEGNTKFKAITPMHLQGASSAIVVADVNRQVTVDHIHEHVESFLSVNPKGFIIVALNKTDLFEDAQLVQMIKCLPFKAEDQVIAIYPTSAKTGAHVDEIFNQLAYKMIAPP